MYSKTMYGMGAESSVIRALFAYGMERSAQIGKDKVFDYSLGNPSVPAPKKVLDTMAKLLQEKTPLELHGYTAGSGDAATRKAVADDLNERYGCKLGANNFYLTCGAAAALKVTMTALFEEGDEALTFAPYFTEYSYFLRTAGYKFTVVGTEDGTFQPDIAKLDAALNENVKLLLINSPNNPSGVVYTKERLEAVAELLEKKAAEYGHPIFLISDEPYRELSYEKEVPFVPAIYKNTIVCYSYSKSFSLPGERIGYVCVPDEVTEAGNVYLAICGAGRALGYVCAPSLMQFVVKECAGERPDLTTYIENRDLLYNSLTSMGYECIYPDGAFYLCVKALEDDDKAFSEKAKKHELLLVPGSEFAAPGYIRAAYCVSTDMIKRSLPAFEALYKEYKG